MAIKDFFELVERASLLVVVLLLLLLEATILCITTGSVLFKDHIERSCSRHGCLVVNLHQKFLVEGSERLVAEEVDNQVDLLRFQLFEVTILLTLCDLVKDIRQISLIPLDT